MVRVMVRVLYLLVDCNGRRGVRLSHGERWEVCKDVVALSF